MYPLITVKWSNITMAYRAAIKTQWCGNVFPEVEKLHVTLYLKRMLLNSAYGNPILKIHACLFPYTYQSLQDSQYISNSGYLWVVIHVILLPPNLLYPPTFSMRLYCLENKCNMLKKKSQILKNNKWKKFFGKNIGINKHILILYWVMGYSNYIGWWDYGLLLFQTPDLSQKCTD